MPQIVYSRTLTIRLKAELEAAGAVRSSVRRKFLCHVSDASVDRMRVSLTGQQDFGAANNSIQFGLEQLNRDKAGTYRDLTLAAFGDRRIPPDSTDTYEIDWFEPIDWEQPLMVSWQITDPTDTIDVPEDLALHVTVDFITDAVQ